MNLQENISTHIIRRTHLIDRVIHIMLQNMYPCDYNSSDHFVEGVLDEIRWFLLDVEELQGIERVDIENYIFDYKYDELTEYFNERCIVLKNDNLQESIRRILKEEKDQTKLIKGIIDSSDIFDYKHFCGFDIITPEERSDQYYFLNKNKIPYLIKVYFVGGPNSEVWPRTQAIQNKELDLMEELHEYIKSFVPFNIEMMGSHVNSCDGYDKLMKRKYTTDDLQESIKKVLKEEDYSPAGKEVTPNNIVIHKSNPMFRDKIMKNGLKVRAGECYKIYVGYGVKCKPAVFATNSTNKRAWFDSTYDDDIWEINTEMIPDVKWYKDRHYESRSKHIVTFQDIPKEAITLKYEGTGSGDVEKWDKDSPNIVRESIKKTLREETDSGKYTKIAKAIADDFKTEEFVCDIDVSYYNEMYEIAVEIDRKEFEKKYENLDVNYATILMKGYLDRLKRNIRQEIKNVLPVDVLVWFKQINCHKSLNESKTSQHLKLMNNLLDPFKEKDCICDIRITFDVEENYYDVYLVFGQEELHEKFFDVVGIRSYIQKMMNEVKMELESFLPIRNIFIGNYTKPNCEWSPLNESEESKQKRKFTKLLNNIEEYINSNSYDSVFRVMVDYDEVMDDVIVNIFFDAEHAVKLGGGINRVIKSTGKKIMEDLSVFPFDFKYHIHFERPQLNESEDDKEKKIQKNLRAIRQLLDTIDVDGLCEMWVEYNPEDGDYEIRSKTTVRYYDMADMAQELGYIEDTIRSWKLKTYVFSPYYVENCEDEIEYLNESEEKKSGLLREIEQDGLFQFIQDTGLSLPQIYTKTGKLPREVYERYIKDFIKQEGYPGWDKGSVQLIFTVEIQKNIQIEQFYMEGDKVTVEISGYNDYGKQTDGYIESLSNLSDDEILTIVENMIKWFTYSEM